MLSNVLAINVNADPTAKVLGGGVVICEEGYVALSVSYTDAGTSPFFHWYMSLDSLVWNEIAGANTAEYVTPLLLDTIWYRVAIETGKVGCETVVSEPTWVRVVPDPAVSISGGATICAGGNAILAATPTGGVPPIVGQPSGCGIFWEKSTDNGATWSVIPGATNYAYLPTNITETTDFRAVWACAGLACDTARSNVERLTVSNPLTATAISNSPICAGEALLLQADGGTQYEWSGPGGFVSDEKNPSRAAAQTGMSGQYLVTVTDADGCTGTAAVQVRVDVCKEICDNNFDDDGDGAIDCFDTDCAVSPFELTASGPTTFCEGGSVALTASGSGPFAWSTGATSASITVEQSGTYAVSVTNAEGCSASRALTVTEVAAPTATAAITGGQPCGGGAVTLTATGGTHYSWAGPGGFSSHWNTLTLNQLSDAQAGIYTVTVANGAGCTATASVALTVSVVQGGFAAAGGAISCTNPNVELSTNGAQNFDYQWTGPSGFVSAAAKPTVAQAGVYEVAATDPASGCVFLSAATVVKTDTTFAASAGAMGELNCLNDSVMLMASASVAGAQFAWSGPSGFASNQASPMVGKPGAYSLTVTSPATGCQQTRTVTISENKAAPSGTISGGNLACGAESVQLSVTPNQPGMVFRWTGPGNFASTLQNPVVAQSGQYNVLIINPLNGCESASLSTTVVIQ